MVIGFTQRTQTVSEANSFGSYTFNVFINIASERVSERYHEIGYRVLHSSTATVVSYNSYDNLNFDAVFGMEEGDFLVEYRSLRPGENVTISSATILTDFIPEEEECFSLRIYPSYYPGIKGLFVCNDDPAFNYFCEHTICIEDYGGKVLQDYI